MKAPSRRFLYAFLVGVGFFRPALAGPDSASASFPADTPITSKMNLGLFGFLGGGMNYWIGGKPITRYEDFKGLIYSLRDEEASDLIREAEDAHYTAWMFYVTGTAVGSDVALFYKPATFLGIGWFDRLATGALVADAFWGVGMLFDANAEARKYNAAQRYNRLIEGKKESALEFNPQVAILQNGPLLLGLNCGF